MRRRPSPEAILTAAVLAAAVVFVLLQLQPRLLLRDTTPTGGDMGAHVWLPDYLRHHLLPKGWITGWTPDWYAGFPALAFYFPLPMLLIVAVDVVLPYGVAFKLVTVLGSLSLPVAAWAFGRLAGFRFPGPLLMGVATLPFLFDRFHTIFGGNIPATLAGEFSFSLALSTGLVFLGVVARGLETGKHRALAPVLLALTALSHVLPTIFVIVAGLLMVLSRLDRHRLRWALTSLPVAALLVAFWVVGFLFRLPYANDMGWEKETSYVDHLFPFLSECKTQSDGTCAQDTFSVSQTNHLKVVIVLALAAAVISIVRRQRLGIVLTSTAVAFALLFRYLPQGRLWNTRFLPFWFLCLYLLAAIAVAELAWAAGSLIANRSAPAAAWVERGASVVVAGAVLVMVALPLDALPGWAPLDTTDRSFIPDWARWNYRGYEGKDAYPEYRAIVNTMARLGEERGCGRAHWENGNDRMNTYGTPMALMLLPYWTDGCIGSMEGLYFESSATTPYHFMTAAEVSKAPSNPQRNLPYGGLDLTKGVRHLQLFGVRYYLAHTPEAQGQADVHPDLRRVATSGPWKVYEVARSRVVEPLDAEPAVVKGVGRGAEDWLDLGIHAYQRLDQSDGVLLARSGPSRWPRVAVHREPTDDKTVGAGLTVDEPRPRPVSPARVTRVRTDDDSVSFDVDRPGSPVLVKVSYFPNWRASGAEGPWRVAPNLMVVVPTSRHVALHYSRTPVDWFGLLLTIAGIALVVVLWRRPPVEYPQPPPEEAEFEKLTLFDFEAEPVEMRQ